MNRLLFSLLRLLVPLLMFATGVLAQAPVSRITAGTALDPAGFAAEMHRLEVALPRETSDTYEFRAFLGQLPASWQVRVADQQYEVSSSPLRTLLADAVRRTSERESVIPNARAWLAEMAAEAEAYGAVRPSYGANPRALAQQILSRPEFTPLRPPSPLELLRRRINAWLLGLLQKFFSSASRHPIGGEILFWLIIAAVVLWLAVSLFRFWTRRSLSDDLTAPEPMKTTRTWQEWIRAARQAADRGNFREAVHSAYWAGIVYLEVAGIVAPDRARTPREYLRSLENAGALEAAPQRQRRETLAALTARLEHVWYGFRPAGPQDFRECLQQLETMGCRLQ